MGLGGVNDVNDVNRMTIGLLTVGLESSRQSYVAPYGDIGAACLFYQKKQIHKHTNTQILKHTNTIW